jgi:hypothetical protein
MVTCVSIGVLIRVEMERLDQQQSGSAERSGRRTGGAVYD